MIHVFEAPGRACKCLAEGCGQCLASDVCTPCKDGCASLGEFLNRPLGLYVAVAILASLAEIGCCVYTLGKGDLQTCVLPEGLAKQVGVAYWLKVQMGCAWLNLIFAPYIQYQLMQKLEEKASSASEGGVRDVDQALVKESFKEVFLYDIGVCLYVFALVGSFVWSFNGANWLMYARAHSEACDPEGWTSYSALLGSSFCWMVVLYSMWWYCYVGCTNSMPVRWAHQYTPVNSGAPPSRAGTAKGVMGAAAGLAAGHSSTAEQGEERLPKPRGCQKACTASQLGKLVACIGLDFFGSASYFLPGLGEGTDLAYAPVQAIALKMLFQSNFFMVFGFTEEILPFTDIIPSATIAWLLDTFAADNCLGRALGLQAYF